MPGGQCAAGGRAGVGRPAVVPASGDLGGNMDDRAHWSLDSRTAPAGVGRSRALVARMAMCTGGAERATGWAREDRCGDVLLADNQSWECQSRSGGRWLRTGGGLEVRSVAPCRIHPGESPRSIESRRLCAQLMPGLDSWRESRSASGDASLERSDDGATPGDNSAAYRLAPPCSLPSRQHQNAAEDPGARPSPGPGVLLRHVESLEQSACQSLGEVDPAFVQGTSEDGARRSRAAPGPGCRPGWTLRPTR